MEFRFSTPIALTALARTVLVSCALAVDASSATHAIAAHFLTMQSSLIDSLGAPPPPPPRPSSSLGRRGPCPPPSGPARGAPAAPLAHRTPDAPRVPIGGAYYAPK